jgi:hypothetical protein
MLLRTANLTAAVVVEFFVFDASVFISRRMFFLLASLLFRRD